MHFWVDVNAEQVIIFPGIHEVLIDECAWGDDASHFASVLRSTFGSCCRIIEELIANSDVFVQVLY